MSKRDGVTRALWFAAPRRAELREEPVAEPADEQVLVRGITSLISAGTEMRVYRGEVDPGGNLGLETFAGSLSFPVKYSYQIVGVVERAGARSGYAPGQRVFARHPHQEAFTIANKPFLLYRLPADLPPRRAAFANLLDVALTCMLDVPVRIGDAVVVYGQGVVGQLLCAARPAHGGCARGRGPDRGAPPHRARVGGRRRGRARRCAGGRSTS